MEYLKQALSLDKQADLLIERGLDADRDVLIQRLSIVSYYRLSGYLFPFREKGSNQFKKGTSLEVVWNRCCFDRKLRILVLDAIERIEVAVRTQLIYHFTHRYGPFGYCDDACLPKLGIEDYLIWRVSLQEETRRSKEIFKQHFFLPCQWHNRVEELFAEYPEIPPKQMGLPEDWANHPVWRPAASGKSLEPGSAFS